MPAIVTITPNPCIDTSTTVDQVVPDRKMRCKTPHYQPGGGGINVARAICRLGGEALAIFPSGGPTGMRLQELLENEGVPQEAIPVRGWTRENFNVVAESSHLQYRFIMPGEQLNEAEWTQCLQRLSSIHPRPEFVVASGSLPPGIPDDFFARVARAAKKLGARCVIDTSGEPLKLAAAEGVFLIKPNVSELCQLTGRPLRDEQDQSGAALELAQSKQSELVVISRGAAGALLATAEGTERFWSPSVHVKSRVGAGDCMLAGIVLGLKRGMIPAAAVRYGIAAGAAATMRSGTELCRREDVEHLHAQML